jgi:hypothetical protein
VLLLLLQLYLNATSQLLIIAVDLVGEDVAGWLGKCQTPKSMSTIGVDLSREEVKAFIRMFLVLES